MKLDNNEECHESFVFMSIFYEQKKWHSLLKVIRREIYDQPDITDELRRAIIYLSFHRGPNIRLALEFKTQDIKIPGMIAASISSFLDKNPSRIEPLTLPITGFLLDFTNNEIRYNLFSERAILSDSLLRFQVLLSKIILVYFEENSVNRNNVFDLVIRLQHAILNGICETKELKQGLCLAVMRQLKKTSNNITDSMIEVGHVSGLSPDETSPTLIPSLSILLSDFEKASRVLYKQNGQTLKIYYTILSVIQLHLFRINGVIFYDSIEHIYNAMEKIPCIETSSPGIEFTQTADNIVPRQTTDDLIPYVLYKHAMAGGRANSGVDRKTESGS